MHKNFYLICEEFLCSAMDFLNLPEKLRLLKFMLSMAEHEPESALSFLEECSYGQIARISLRDPKRRLLEKSWKPGLLVKRAKTAALACQALGIKIELYGGKLYPPLLREICDPPFALYYRGALDVLFGKSVSVVGTRRLSPDGIKASRTFAYQAAQKGFCVVSGLAFGADGSAHQGAVDAFYDKSAPRVQTAAVLAGGVDNIFPPSHKGLAGKIIQNGGVVLSECPPCVPAEKWRFVQRNRIIAALSKATVVIQAPPGSKRRDFLKGGAGDHSDGLSVQIVKFCVLGLRCLCSHEHARYAKHALPAILIILAMLVILALLVILAIYARSRGGHCRRRRHGARRLRCLALAQDRFQEFVEAHHG